MGYLSSIVIVLSLWKSTTILHSLFLKHLTSLIPPKLVLNMANQYAELFAFQDFLLPDCLLPIYEFLATYTVILIFVNRFYSMLCFMMFNIFL